MRQSDRTAIAFIIICIVSGSLVYVFLRDSDTTDNRRPSAAFTREKNGGAYYAQPDVGYGNGNMAVNYGLKAELFPFDPNTADSTTLLRLGLKPWQVRNIYKYRAHGGRYRRREDFARLYGLTLSQYRRLEPYIHIEKDVMAADVIGKGTAITPAGYEDAYPSSTSLGQMTSGRRAAEHDNTCPSHSVRPAKLTLDDDKVDINTADTTLLKRIPGIGSYYARRIVELRQRKKTFLSAEELLVIRNFPETALAYMTVLQDFPVISINTMTQKELHAHPLLNYTQAHDIVSLRRTTGRITSMEDLRFLKSFTPELLSRIEPFIRFE